MFTSAYRTLGIVTELFKLARNRFINAHWDREIPQIDGSRSPQLIGPWEIWMTF